jgi:hypothetical protein
MILLVQMGWKENIQYNIYSIYSIYGMYSTVYWCWEICFETDTVQYCTYSITCTVNGGCSNQSSSDFFKALYLFRISSPSSCSFASAALLAFSLISNCTAIFFNSWQTVENCALNVGNYGAIQKWLFLSPEWNPYSTVILLQILGSDVVQY